MDVLLEEEACDIPQDLVNAYREMATDERREAEAREWAKSVIGDAV